MVPTPPLAGGLSGDLVQGEARRVGPDVHARAALAGPEPLDRPHRERRRGRGRRGYGRHRVLAAVHLVDLGPRHAARFAARDENDDLAVRLDRHDRSPEHAAVLEDQLVRASAGDVSVRCSRRAGRRGLGERRMGDREDDEAHQTAEERLERGDAGVEGEAQFTHVGCLRSRLASIGTVRAIFPGPS
jgi:hypothetical protein